MAYSNLSGIFPKKQDGNLYVATQVDGPIFLILGTAEDGPSDTPYTVVRTSDAASAFGREGTLIRGMYETADQAKNIVLFRINATSAKLEHIGDTSGAAGITLETVEKDDSAGSHYELFWSNSEGRLMVWNTVTGELIYDNDPDTPDNRIDANEVSVSGTAGAVGADIGTVSAPVVMASVVTAGTAYTAGTDGTDPSRMKLFEALHESYQLLENVVFDYVLPMDIYLDDVNTQINGSTPNSTVISGIDAAFRNNSGVWVSGHSYPTAATNNDVLGRYFTEEYGGKDYFFWDIDNDNIAEVWPNVGSASATLKIDGTSITSGDWHEANFGYQLANFLYTYSENVNEALSAIGTLPPNSFSLADISTWIGKLPTYTLDPATGIYTIAASADNGTGLLGNKFAAGSSYYRSGSNYGGMVATDSGYLDGTDELDDNSHIIDIGKYIAVVPQYVYYFNPIDTTGFGYVATYASKYLSKVSALPANSAPTNKVENGIKLPFIVRNQKNDQLAGVKYTMLTSRNKQIVIADAPTFARQDSDYRRVSTVKIVKEVIDRVRAVGMPFIGEATSKAGRLALKTAIDAELAKLQKAGRLTRFSSNVTATVIEQVQGNATVELVLVPAFELRQIFVKLSLNKA